MDSAEQQHKNYYTGFNYVSIFNQYYTCLNPPASAKIFQSYPSVFRKQNETFFQRGF